MSLLPFQLAKTRFERAPGRRGSRLEFAVGDSVKALQYVRRQSKD
jgi:hypothetical protein